MTKSLKKVSVSGQVILSTIATMETLGPIGEEVLLSNGIKDIDKEKQYPYEVRNAIHKAVLDKYGEIALLAIGFKNAELLDEFMGKPAIDFAAKEIDGMSSQDLAINASSLDRVLQFYFERSGSFIKKVTSGIVGVEYGHKLEKIDNFKYRNICTMALEDYSEPFIRGVQVAQLYQILGKYYRWDRKYEPKLSHSGYGYATWSWIMHFSPEKSKLPSAQILNDKKNQINAQLTKVVLTHSFEQNKKMENLSQQIGKYIPPQINEALFKGDYDTQITTRRKKLTIFFSDIKNFTSTSEGLQPEDLTKYLNEYFSEMTTIAIDCGATIDKYIGDAMMVFFGDPDTKGEREDARSCVEMALSMQERMVELQNKWRNEGFADPFQVRMGINTGYCNVGNFGSDQRLTYTIIGGEVNVAQRLEGNSDANGILMSYETFAHAQDMVEAEERDAIKMKGINRDIKSFAIIGRSDSKSEQEIVDTESKSIQNVGHFSQGKSINNRVDALEQKLAVISNKLDEVLIATHGEHGPK